MIDLDNLRIKLSQEEQDILRGKQGETLQKVMKTLVLYGEALGAERLVDIEGEGHFAIPWATPGIAPPLEMLDELVVGGLKTKSPFTLDPRAPLDFENLYLRPEQEQVLEEMYRDQPRYDERMLQLGLRDADAYTCNPYLPEVGNTPQRDTILAWSESACVIFANSILGARSNRNGVIMDLLSNIVGKTPFTGLLTDEGRRASWLVEVRTKKLPNPQLLGAVIGKRVLDGVPFIIGLDRFLSSEINEETQDFLHEMGATCATYGAVGLYHVEHITPEAREQGRELIIRNPSTYHIDDQELQNQLTSYPVLWEDKEAKPEKCLIGCPHLSLRQLNWWSEKILNRLETQTAAHLSVNTILCAAPGVIQKFKSDRTKYERMLEVGVRFSPSCAETLYEGEVCTGDAIITNSCKLRAYSTARFIPDEELVGVLVDGEIQSGR
jgi:predicted aconitase